MKKYTVFSMILVSILILTACNGDSDFPKDEVLDFYNDNQTEISDSTAEMDTIITEKLGDVNDEYEVNFYSDDGRLKMVVWSAADIDSETTYEISNPKLIDLAKNLNGISCTSEYTEFTYDWQSPEDQESNRGSSTGIYISDSGPINLLTIGSDSEFELKKENNGWIYGNVDSSHDSYYYTEKIGDDTYYYEKIVWY